MKIPQTIDEIMLIQPNNVTFGQYEVTEVQENIITLIVDAIQEHVTHKKELPRDLFNQPYVEIICDEAKGQNSKNQVKKAIRDMYNKPFTFKWVHPEIHKTIESSGTIISTMHDIKGTNKVIINFNVWAIPFFVYYGVGVGGTRFNKNMALKLRGDYTKRIYKMICRWQDKTHFEYDIEQFKTDLSIPKSYQNPHLKKYILEVSRERIKEISNDVWFDYEFISKRPKKGRKPKADTILFYIKTLNPQQVGGEQYEVWKYVYEWLKHCYGIGTSKAQQYTDKLSEIGVLEEVYNRIKYWSSAVDKTGERYTQQHIENLIRKKLREDYNLN